MPSPISHCALDPEAVANRQIQSTVRGHPLLLELAIVESGAFLQYTPAEDIYALDTLGGCHVGRTQENSR